MGINTNLPDLAAGAIIGAAVSKFAPGGGGNWKSGAMTGAVVVALLPAVAPKLAGFLPKGK